MPKRKHAAHGCKENNIMDLNEFEQARLQRIEQNRQVLADMGLDHAAEEIAASARQQKRQAHRQQLKNLGQGCSVLELQPTRRSRRLAKEPAVLVEHTELLDTTHSRPASSSTKARQPSSSKALEQLDPNTHHNHNMHRIKTMSERALITRAWKITNVCKLKSFIEVLEAAGDLEVVAEQARAALADLTGRAQS